MLGQLDKNTHGWTNTQGLWITEEKASAAFLKTSANGYTF